MITESYPLDYTNDKLFFQFKSIGKSGVIDKVILFQWMEVDRFNLAFGDVVGEELDDKVISDNGDIIKVISTIAQSVYLFFEDYPNAIIEIQGVDEKRQRLYNHIFKRRKLEIEDFFDLQGLIDNEYEPIQNDQYYEKFVIQKKNK